MANGVKWRAKSCWECNECGTESRASGYMFKEGRLIRIWERQALLKILHNIYVFMMSDSRYTSTNHIVRFLAIKHHLKNIFNGNRGKKTCIQLKIPKVNEKNTHHHTVYMKGPIKYTAIYFCCISNQASKAHGAACDEKNWPADRIVTSLSV